MWSDRPAARIRAAAGELAAWLPSVPGRRGGAPEVFDVPVVDPQSILASENSVRWLDGGAAGRHLIGLRPRVSLRSVAGRVELETGGDHRSLDLDEFSALEAANRALAANGYAGARWFGWLGYELGGRLERLPPPPNRDARTGVADLSLVLHDAWLEGAGDRWSLVVVDGEPPVVPEVLLAGEARPASAPAKDPLRRVPVRMRPDDAAYEGAVARTIERIVRGEIFETNVCRTFEAEWPAGRASARELYRSMRSGNPARYGALIEEGDYAVLSMSPERYLRRRAAEVSSEPIKGTRPRGEDAERDDRAVRELMDSEKDAAELAMIVDLVRNDLSRVCQVGSVRVEEHRRRVRLPTVWHTQSRIVGRMEAERRSEDLLRASFPPGSITGAPKIQAMIAAAAEEPTRRGPSMGAIGWLQVDGDLDLSVAIRTAVVGGGLAVYHAGCGIVADSDPVAEREESFAKARAFVEALRR